MYRRLPNLLTCEVTYNILKTCRITATNCKQGTSFPHFQGNFEPVTVQSIAATATLHEPQAIMDAGAGYMSRSMCLLDSAPLKGRLLLAAWDHGITQVADNVTSMLQEATQVQYS